ncbi:MAG: sigma-70 family RNA polymerase sigma factor [Lewinellaceae bacterium]|nr:sigma-70 family RNA polymerase sigma factor [Lewinella sp.]MCB9282029.1 sigma-70 family RNA polymerase sigma factor [Lewinellaceae bacterium]
MAKYQERLYRHIRRLVIDHEDANDVLQNCLIKAFRAIDRFEGKSGLYTWLYRIASNEAFTFLERKKRKMAASIDGEDQLAAANRLRADSYFNGDEAQALLHRALTGLPDKQREVFTLRYFEDMGYQEMSDMLGTSVGALKASYHHAVKKIEQFFKNEQIR